MNVMDNVGRNTIAMVLAGGKGERLTPLTERRAKPSLSFGGKYKIIDFVLSNLFNSGLKKVYILTQYRAYSLNKHIRESWGKWAGLGEFFVDISPETSSESEQWFIYKRGLCNRAAKEGGVTVRSEVGARGGGNFSQCGRDPWQVCLFYRFIQ